MLCINQFLPALALIAMNTQFYHGYLALGLLILYKKPCLYCVGVMAVLLYFILFP